MAEKHLEDGKNGCGSVAVSDTQDEVNSVKHTSKRCSSGSPSTVPPPKSPRTDSLSPTKQMPDAREGQCEMDTQERLTENTAGPTGPPVSPTARRKSWRRVTLTRRSLPALPNPYQALCGNISSSLSQEERLEKLMEASMKLAIERTQNSLQSVPNTSQESFKKQVEHIQKEWGCLAKSMRCELQLSSSAASSSDPAVQRAMEKVKRTINRLQAESESWEALLNKHRRKAEELERKVEQGQKGGIFLDSSSVAQSSQYHFIQSKPDYHGLLCRQRPMLHTMAMIMDTQHKMVREFLSIKEHAQLLVKEASGRLAADSGLQDLSSDPLRSLMAAPLSTATI